MYNERKTKGTSTLTGFMALSIIVQATGFYYLTSALNEIEVNNNMKNKNSSITYTAENVGDRFKITLDTDNEITVIIGDIKQDVHTDYFNQYTPIYDENGIFFSGNVLEFIVDTDVLPKVPRRLGTVSYFNYLKGNIKSIERIETEE